MKLPILTFDYGASTAAQYSPTMSLKRGKDIVFAYRHAGTGTLVATMFVELGVSIPGYLTEAPRVQWKTTTMTFDTLPAGSANSDSETFYVGGYDCVRLKITPTAGAGTIELSANIKD